MNTDSNSSQSKAAFDREYFEQECYHAYQLDWMISHGHSLKSYSYGLAHSEEDMALSGNAFQQMDQRMDAFEDVGFDGSIYVCKDEFLQAEYLDADYMYHLLSLMPDSEVRRSKWQQYTGQLFEEEHLEVQTTAGGLRAYKTSDPGEPGICVMLTPAGACDGDEIDTAYVSVIEDELYTTPEFNERPVDVVVRAYGNPCIEDYTYRAVIRREDVTEALEIPVTWDELCVFADGEPCGSRKLKAKDTARGNVGSLAKALGLPDPEKAEIPEEAIEDICQRHKVTFDTYGNILSYKGGVL